MKLIYVAGKYAGKGYSEIEDNIFKAELASIKLLKFGWAVITPHKNTAHYERYEDYIGYTHDDWLKMDFAMLERCDAIFMLKDWEYSKGASMEHQLAIDKGLEIYYQDDGFPKPAEDSK